MWEGLEGDNVAPLVLRASRAHWAKVGAGVAGFTLVSALLVHRSPTLWFPLIFFGTCTAVAMLQLINPGTLTISATTLTVRKLGQNRKYELTKCGEFKIWRNPMGGNRVVVF